MSGASLKIALVATGMVVTFIVASTIIASAGSKSKLPSPGIAHCNARFQNCKNDCKRTQIDLESNLGACQNICGENHVVCVGEASSKQTTTAPPTGTPPKGKGVQETVGVSGDKQVGGSSSRPKGKVGLGQVNVGVQQLGSGTPPKGKSVQDTVNVGPTQGDTTTSHRGGGGKGAR